MAQPPAGTDQAAKRSVPLAPVTATRATVVRCEVHRPRTSARPFSSEEGSIGPTSRQVPCA